MGIHSILFLGMSALCMRFGTYEAVVVPQAGANLLRLYEKEKGVDVLRTPGGSDSLEFRRRPQVFGLPVLFPPNRIADGFFTFEGRPYHFPITLAKQHNHHHGILKSEPFTVVRQTEGEDFVEVELLYTSDSTHGRMFAYFPHEFECRIVYRLSGNGLQQAVTFINRSDRNMPLGVGWHTTFNVPFMSGTDKENYSLRLSCGKLWETDERGLPTERLLILKGPEHNLSSKTGMYPFAKPLDATYMIREFRFEGSPFRGAILQDNFTGVCVFYEFDHHYKDVTLLNISKEGDYLCIEPQSWAVNAPNLSFAYRKSGFLSLPPGESWCAVTKIYVN